MVKFSETLGRALLIFSVLVLLTIGLGAFIPVNGEDAVYTDTLRLHVLANSDSEADQALKLKVRDAVLNVMRELNENGSCTDIDKASDAVRENIALIENTARDTVISNGYDYTVHAELCREYFPTREYEGVRLPAGEYTALRILIGKAEGRNWWCVLYPSLCIDAAHPKEELREAGFTSAQIRLLTDSESPRYVLRFRFLEWLGELKHGN